jgi:amino acid adenylation domain-containing protein
VTDRSIAEFVTYLASLDVQLAIDDELRLRCNAPAGTLTSALRLELADRKPELISYLKTAAIQPAPPTTQGTIFPLSFAQQRLWFLDRLAPANPFYNIPAAMRLTGTRDRTALERSIAEIVRRHAALRTTFKLVDGQPVQAIDPTATVQLAVVNLRSVAAIDRDRIGQQLATAQARQPFNLTTDPLLRVALLEFDDTEALLILTLHHIVADGWSLGVLMRELGGCYRAFVSGRTPELPALALQYTDFAIWQREWLQGEVLATQLQYWREQLADLSILDLPSDRPRPAVPTYRGANYPLQIAPPLAQALAELSQQAGASLFMTLLAAFQTLLYRYTGQPDLAIGSPIANRNRSEFEGQIGFFVNSLVMRSQLSGELTFRQLLAQVRETALAAYEHQDLPFEKLVEELAPDRDPSRNPLFQVAFALQNAPMQPLELPGLRLEPLQLESGSTRFDLEVHLWEPTHGLRSLWQSPDGLSGFIAYSTDLFDRERIDRLSGHFQTLLAGIVADPDARLGDLPLLTPIESQQLRGWDRAVESAVTAQPCFQDIFTVHARAHPTAIAIVSATGLLTYQELDRQADRLAQTLIQMGVQAEDLVGLCVDRSADSIVGILGILKAGGAYVPLDPCLPSDRLQFMLSDTQVAIVLTQSWLVADLPTAPAKILCLDRELPPQLATQPLPPADPKRLAYVIYTSGSTGTPKGVLLSHQGLSNVIAAQQQNFHLSQSSRVLQFSSLSFDASAFEIALALGCGGTLYIPPPAAQLPGMELIEFLATNAITHALLTPAVLAVLPPAPLPELKVLITGGDTCSSQVIDRWAENRHFFNAYGPTETTIWATIAELNPGDNPLVIGRPIANTQIYLLDANLNPVPIGIPGELYIGGAGVASGYLNRPELTTERFIDRDSIRLYRTGDRACYRTDGSIEFRGRIDGQIKIRGFRVELGEIEATLQRHPAVRAAAAIAAGDTSNPIAYFSLNRPASHQSLQTDRIEHWQSLYDRTYREPVADPQFDITGWNSSYTGAPIPLDQMQAWVSDRVRQILALKPQRILEIGCGTGLLLFPLAPQSERYVGTDFSAVSLASIRSQLPVLNLPQVELQHRMATDFEGIEPAAFDLVILNSIVQYFPSGDYLLQVITQAIERVAPGGVIFLGDVRSLPLLAAFHSWVKFDRADAGMGRTQLRHQVERAQFESPELAIDPLFFQALRDRFPQIRHVQIHLTRGRSQNEMTQFRYNVWLHIDTPSSPPAEAIQIHNWQLEPTTVAATQQQLFATAPAIFRLTNLPNSRIAAAVKTAHWLSSPQAPKTVGRMRELLQHSPEPAIDPQDWWDLEAVLPYTVEITWSERTQTGDYDVLFVRHDVVGVVDLPIQPPLDRDWHDLTNDPLQSLFARQLVPQLRAHSIQTLPDYMVPAAFIPLAKLPLTVNGKIDRRALPPIERAIQAASEPTTPLTPTAAKLIEIWQELLQLDRLNLHDNFFELGGHSLLATQMTSRVRDVFGLELPLKSVFAAPTIAQLTPLLETLCDTPSAPQTPPLVRLDRAAYRHQRSTLPSPERSLIPDRSVPDARSPLVPLTLGGTKPPFFCVHPMFGVIFPYLELAQQLQCDRSFYGLQPLGLDGTSAPLTQIEAMAAYYIRAIQTIQPHGPYFLGGWSFGGLVAFEMAQQLDRAGESIDLLAILDTPAPTSQLSLDRSLKYLFGTALWSTLPFLVDYGAIATNRFIRSWQPWLSRMQWSAIVRQIPEESRLQLMDESAISPLLKIVYANNQAAYHYVPKPYTKCLTLFKADAPSSLTGQDSTAGWSDLATNIQLHSVPGNHLSLLKQPHVGLLAEQLRQYLA